ncbi:MAG TPA: hypothetical protein VIL20_18320 [Sandaracinaceae bacterium]
MGSRLFVGNLPYACSEADLRGLFEPRFAVRDVRIVTDRDTGRSRGFAFVELEGGADEAIDALDGSELGGRKLAVREARERAGKPSRRDGARKQPEVQAMVRRSGFRETRMRVKDGRLWQAPLDPSELESWGPPPGRADGKRRDEDA